MCLISISVFAAYVDTSDWEFPDVCKYYFGAFGKWSSLIFSLVSLIGAMVVYWVLMSNFLFNTGKFIYSKTDFIHLIWSNVVWCGLHQQLNECVLHLQTMFTMSARRIQSLALMVQIKVSRDKELRSKYCWVFLHSCTCALLWFPHNMWLYRT